MRYPLMTAMIRLCGVISGYGRSACENSSQQATPNDHTSDLLLYFLSVIDSGAIHLIGTYAYACAGLKLNITSEWVKTTNAIETTLKR